MDKTKIAIDVFNKLANAYQDKFMDVSLYCVSLDFFCSHIKKENAGILELACGPGNITKYLLHKRPDFKVSGIDLAANMIKLAEINNPEAEFQLMDCREIGTIDKKYDAIMCGFCLPYLSKDEALKLISDASKLLNAEGLFYLSTMEDEYSKSGFKKGSSGDEIYMNYHQADYLTEALKKNHFKILSLKRQDYHEADGTKMIDLILISEKQ
ncbi:MAG: class I SAM-dependent methyltransferase [Bacteroidota bacterium]